MVSIQKMRNIVKKSDENIKKEVEDFLWAEYILNNQKENIEEQENVTNLDINQINAIKDEKTKQIFLMFNITRNADKILSDPAIKERVTGRLKEKKYMQEWQDIDDGIISLMKNIKWEKKKWQEFMAVLWLKEQESSSLIDEYQKFLKRKYGDTQKLLMDILQKNPRNNNNEDIKKFTEFIKNGEIQKDIEKIIRNFRKNGIYFNVLDIPEIYEIIYNITHQDGSKEKIVRNGIDDLLEKIDALKKEGVDIDGDSSDLKRIAETDKEAIRNITEKDKQTWKNKIELLEEVDIPTRLYDLHTLAETDMKIIYDIIDKNKQTWENKIQLLRKMETAMYIRIDKLKEISEINIWTINQAIELKKKWIKFSSHDIVDDFERIQKLDPAVIQNALIDEKTKEDKIQPLKENNIDVGTSNLWTLAEISIETIHDAITDKETWRNKIQLLKANDVDISFYNLKKLAEINIKTIDKTMELKKKWIKFSNYNVVDDLERIQKLDPSVIQNAIIDEKTKEDKIQPLKENNIDVRTSDLWTLAEISIETIHDAITDKETHENKKKILEEAGIPVYVNDLEDMAKIKIKALRDAVIDRETGENKKKILEEAGIYIYNVDGIKDIIQYNPTKETIIILQELKKTWFTELVQNYRRSDYSVWRILDRISKYDVNDIMHITNIVRKTKLKEKGFHLSIDDLAYLDDLNIKKIRKALNIIKESLKKNNIKETDTIKSDELLKQQYKIRINIGDLSIINSYPEVLNDLIWLIESKKVNNQYGINGLRELGDLNEQMLKTLKNLYNLWIIQTMALDNNNFRSYGKIIEKYGITSIDKIIRLYNAWMIAWWLELYEFDWYISSINDFEDETITKAIYIKNGCKEEFGWVSRYIKELLQTVENLDPNTIENVISARKLYYSLWQNHNFSNFIEYMKYIQEKYHGKKISESWLQQIEEIMIKYPDFISSNIRRINRADINKITAIDIKEYEVDEISALLDDTHKSKENIIISKDNILHTMKNLSPEEKTRLEQKEIKMPDEIKYNAIDHEKMKFLNYFEENKKMIDLDKLDEELFKTIYQDDEKNTILRIFDGENVHIIASKLTKDTKKIAGLRKIMHEADPRNLRIIIDAGIINTNHLHILLDDVLKNQEPEKMKKTIEILQRSGITKPEDLVDLKDILCKAEPENLEIIIKNSIVKFDTDSYKKTMEKLKQLVFILWWAKPENLKIVIQAGFKTIDEFKQLQSRNVLSNGRPKSLDTIINAGIHDIEDINKLDYVIEYTDTKNLKKNILILHKAKIRNPKTLVKIWKILMTAKPENLEVIIHNGIRKTKDLMTLEYVLEKSDAENLESIVGIMKRFKIDIVIFWPIIFKSKPRNLETLINAGFQTPDEFEKFQSVLIHAKPYDLEDRVNALREFGIWMPKDLIDLERILLIAKPENLKLIFDKKIILFDKDHLEKTKEEIRELEKFLEEAKPENLEIMLNAGLKRIVELNQLKNVLSSAKDKNLEIIINAGILSLATGNIENTIEEINKRSNILSNAQPKNLQRMIETYKWKNMEQLRWIESFIVNTDELEIIDQKYPDIPFDDLIRLHEQIRLSKKRILVLQKLDFYNDDFQEWVQMLNLFSNSMVQSKSIFDALTVKDGVNDKNRTEILSIYAFAMYYDDNQDVNKEISDQIKKIINDENDMIKSAANKKILYNKVKSILEKSLWERPKDEIGNKERALLEIIQSKWCGFLTYMETMSNFCSNIMQKVYVTSIPQDVQKKMIDGIRDFLDSKNFFKNSPLRDMDSFNGFFNISNTIITAEPSLYNEFLEIFKILDDEWDMDFFHKLFNLYQVELVLYQKYNQGNNEITYEQSDLEKVRQTLKSFISSLKDNNKEKHKDIFRTEQERLINNIKKLFKDKLGIIKTPEIFTNENIESIKTYCVYLTNMHDKTPAKEKILWFFLALKLDNKWAQFRQWDDINPAEYVISENTVAINEYLAKRKEYDVLKWLNLDQESRIILQKEDQHIMIGHVNDIIDKLKNIESEIESLSDPDLLQTDEERIIFPYCKGNDSKTIWAILAIKIKNSELDNEQKKVLDEVGEKLWITDWNKESIERIQNVLDKKQDKTLLPYCKIDKSRTIWTILAIKFKNGELNNEQKKILDEVGEKLWITDWNKESIIKVQNILLTIQMIQQFINNIKSLNIEWIVAEIEAKSIMDDELIGIFCKLWENFSTESGIYYAQLDIDQQRENLEKNKKNLSEHEIKKVETYLETMDKHVAKIDKLRKNIETRMIKFQDEDTKNFTNGPLKERIKEVMQVVNSHTTWGDDFIQSKIINDLDMVLPIIRACLSGKTNGCNNDTNLTFGDSNRFLIVNKFPTPNGAKKITSYADQLINLLPTNKWLSFVMDGIYGTKSVDSLVCNILLLIKKLQQMKNKDIGIIVTNNALGGATKERLMEGLSKETEVQFDIEEIKELPLIVTKSASWDPHHEFHTWWARSTGNFEVSWLYLKLK